MTDQTPKWYDKIADAVFNTHDVSAIQPKTYENIEGFIMKKPGRYVITLKTGATIVATTDQVRDLCSFAEIPLPSNINPSLPYELLLTDD